jgi:DnaK suppressor protein
MPSKTTDRPKLAAHRRRLEELLVEAQERLARTTADYDALAESNEDVGAGDDEGGSEANQTFVERDRLKAAAAVDAELVETVVAALERAGTKGWSTCRVCGNEIGGARLEAIPTADRCVSCKAASTTW